MNKIYKVIWSKAKNCYVVVSELAKRVSRSASPARASKACLAAVMAATALTVGTIGMDTVQAAPTYGTVDVDGYDYEHDILPAVSSNPTGNMMYDGGWYAPDGKFYTYVDPSTGEINTAGKDNNGTPWSYEKETIYYTDDTYTIRSDKWTEHGRTEAKQSPNGDGSTALNQKQLTTLFSMGLDHNALADSVEDHNAIPSYVEHLGGATNTDFTAQQVADLLKDNLHFNADLNRTLNEWEESARKATDKYLNEKIETIKATETGTNTYTFVNGDGTTTEITFTDLNTDTFYTLETSNPGLALDEDGQLKLTVKDTAGKEVTGIADIGKYVQENAADAFIDDTHTTIKQAINTNTTNITNINADITALENADITGISHTGPSYNAGGTENGTIVTTLTKKDGTTIRSNEVDISGYVGDKINYEAAKAEYNTANNTYASNTIGGAIKNIEDTYVSDITDNGNDTWTVKEEDKVGSEVIIKDTYVTGVTNTLTSDGKLTTTITQNQNKHDVVSNTIDIKDWADDNYAAKTVTINHQQVDTTTQVVNNYTEITKIKNDMGDVTTIKQDGSGTTTGNTVVSNINNIYSELGKGWTATIDGTPVNTVKMGSTQDFKAGANIVLTNDNGAIKIATANDVSFKTITLTDASNNTQTTVQYNNNRIEYITNVPNSSSMTTNVIATMNDGMQFAADNGQTITRKLNETLAIKGDGNNISTTADTSTGAISVSLNDDIKVKTINVDDSVTINNNGITIENGNNDIIINKNEVNVGGNKVTNVQNGDISQNSTDAVNGSQLWETNQAVNNLSGEVSRLGHRTTKAVAGAAALAALHPLDFDPDDKLSFSAGVGNYGGSTAAAIGAFYRPNERVMFSIGGTVGNGEDMVNAGVSFALGKGGKVNTSRVAMTHEINDLRQQVAYLSAVVAQMAANSGYQFNDMKAFPDTPENHWAYEYIAKLAAEGIIEGYPDGNFSGDRTMTRYEYAAMLFRALEKGFQLDTRVIDEFEPELGRLSVERIKGEQNQKNKIERVRVNDSGEDRDVYGGKINVGKNWP